MKVIFRNEEARPWLGPFPLDPGANEHFLNPSHVIREPRFHHRRLRGLFWIRVNLQVAMLCSQIWADRSSLVA